MLGRFTIAAAMATFCWFPPDSDPIGSLTDAAFDLELVAQLVRDPEHPPRTKRDAAWGDLPTEAGHHVVADGQVGEQARMAVRRDETRPLRHGGRPGARTDLDLARRALEPRDRADELARARPFDADDRNDLADLHVQVDPLELAAGVRPSGQPQAGALALGARDDRLVGVPRGLSAHEPGRDAVRGQRLALEQVGTHAVEDQGDAVRVLGQLGDPVRDQQHDVAGIGEQVHPPEQVLRLLLGQRGVRLIEEEHPRITRQRATDLDALVDRQRDIGELAVGDVQDRQVVMSERSAAVRRRTVARVPSRPTMRFSATVRFGKSCGS